MNIALIDRELCLAEEEFLEKIRINKSNVILLRGWNGCGSSNCHTYIAPEDADLDLVSWIKKCSNVVNGIRYADNYNADSDYIYDWDFIDNKLTENEESNIVYLGFVVSGLLIANKGEEIQTAIEAYRYMCNKYEDFAK